MNTFTTDLHDLKIFAKKIQKTLNKLRLGFLFIAIGAIFYFIILIATAAYLFNIRNTHFGVILPGFVFFIGLITTLLPLRYILILFQKISFGLNQVKQHDEPALFELLNEIKNEISLKKIPKIYVENVDVILSEYSNQFDSLFRPNKINLIIGIIHFQTLTREELKALIVKELSKYKDENELNLIRFRNWQFSTGNMFYSSELTEETRFSKFTILFFYIYICEHFLMKVHHKFSNQIQAYENQLNNLNTTKKVKSKAYTNAINKISEYIILTNFVEYQLTEVYSNFYGIANQYEVIREIIKRSDLRKTLIKKHYNLFIHSSLFTNHFVNYYFQDYIKQELNRAENNIEIEYTKDTFHLKNQEEFELRLSHFNTYNRLLNSGEFLQIIEEYDAKTTFTDFIEVINNFIGLDFEKLFYSAKDSSNHITKADLINVKNIQLIKETSTLVNDFEYIQLLDNFDYNGIHHNNKKDINKTLNQLNIQIISNFKLIENFKENLYIYLKSNISDSSLKTIQKINHLKDIKFNAKELFHQLDQLKDEIYTETSNGRLKELFDEYDEKIEQLKVQMIEILEEKELENLLPKDLLDFLYNEAKETFIYYENGIYSKEAFERIEKLSYWNLNLTTHLMIRYQKIYFGLNHHLLN